MNRTVLSPHVASTLQSEGTISFADSWRTMISKELESGSHHRVGGLAFARGNVGPFARSSVGILEYNRVHVFGKGETAAAEEDEEPRWS